MVRFAPERVLLIGDTQREVHDSLLAAMPGAQLTTVGSIFDGIAELAGNHYTTVIAAADPIEHRPEAAVRVLRDLAGEGRLILFGQPVHEVLSRRMMRFGCDDYLVLPASNDEIQQLFGTPPMRLASPDANDAADTSGNGAEPAEQAIAHHDAQPRAEAGLSELALADLLLDALLHHPADPMTHALKQINALLAPAMELVWHAGDEPAPPRATALPDAGAFLSHAVRVNNDPAGMLYLAVSASAGDDDTAARHTLAQIAHLLGKLASLQDRHARLQKLAITDELTGVFNARYFRHFLQRILERARQIHFPVTLLLFDIDDFKQYNDRYGHGVGDEILKQTAALMRRSTRDHDLVARIGGDEFAVVFWDKEGPRQPREPRPGVTSRPPHSPIQVFERFKRLLAGDGFTALGPSGKGVLGISGGLAVYPYDAHDAASLLAEADRALMMGAKRKTGKNSIFLVGTEQPIPPSEARS